MTTNTDHNNTDKAYKKITFKRKVNENKAEKTKVGEQMKVDIAKHGVKSSKEACNIDDERSSEIFDLLLKNDDSSALSSDSTEIAKDMAQLNFNLADARELFTSVARKIQNHMGNFEPHDPEYKLLSINDLAAIDAYFAIVDGEQEETKVEQSEETLSGKDHKIRPCIFKIFYDQYIEQRPTSFELPKLVCKIAKGWNNLSWSEMKQYKIKYVESKKRDSGVKKASRPASNVSKKAGKKKSKLFEETETKSHDNDVPIYDTARETAQIEESDSHHTVASLSKPSAIEINAVKPTKKAKNKPRMHTVLKYKPKKKRDIKPEKELKIDITREAADKVILDNNEAILTTATNNYTQKSVQNASGKIGPKDNGMKSKQKNAGNNFRSKKKHQQIDNDETHITNPYNTTKHDVDDCLKQDHISDRNKISSYYLANNKERKRRLHKVDNNAYKDLYEGHHDLNTLENSLNVDNDDININANDNNMVDMANHAQIEEKNKNTTNKDLRIWHKGIESKLLHEELEKNRSMCDETYVSVVSESIYDIIIAKYEAGIRDSDITGQNRVNDEIEVRSEGIQTIKQHETDDCKQDKETKNNTKQELYDKYNENKKNFTIGNKEAMIDDKQKSIETEEKDVEMNQASDKMHQKTLNSENPKVTEVGSIFTDSTTFDKDYIDKKSYEHLDASKIDLHKAPCIETNTKESPSASKQTDYTHPEIDKKLRLPLTNIKIRGKSNFLVLECILINNKPKNY